LKKIVSPPSPATEPVAAPPAPAPVDPYMLGLRDAVLSGWFNQETDELFSGFPISAEDTVLDVGCGDGGNVHFCAMRGAR
ncbi:class I SAM-dependent methyltransferase, partial [Pseudomonas aeruginosa]